MTFTSKDTFCTIFNICAYAIVVLLCWSLAIWDAVNVVTTYLTDNRVTLVRLVTIDNRSTDFLEDTIACVDYDTSVFEQIWWNDREVKNIVEEAYDFERGWNATKRVLEGINFSKLDPDGGLNLTKQQLIHAAKVVSSMQTWDVCAYYYSLKYTKRNDLTFCLDDRPSPISWDDKKLALLSKSVLKWMQEASSKNHSQVERNQVCTLIDVRQVWTRSDAGPAESVAVPLGVKYKNETVGIDALAKTGAPQMLLYFPNFAAKSLRFTSDSSNKSFQITVMITTRGVFDRRNITDAGCSKEVLPRFRTCLDKHYAVVISRKCGCIPLMQKILIPQSTLPYCTPEHYGKPCMEAVLNRTYSYQCEPCFTTQNEYVVTYVSQDGSLFEHPDGYYRFQIGFIVRDKYYSSYEETTKNTMAQTIAQVGGDLGFYTGFSMWALWKFIVFIINHYRTHHQEPSRQAQQQGNVRRVSQATTALKTSLEMAAAFVRDGDSDEQQVRKERDFETRLRRMETMIEQILENQKKMQNDPHKVRTSVHSDAVPQDASP